MISCIMNIEWTSEGHQHYSLSLSTYKFKAIHLGKKKKKGGLRPNISRTKFVIIREPQSMANHLNNYNCKPQAPQNMEMSSSFKQILLHFLCCWAFCFSS